MLETKKMKIGIDARTIFTAEQTGVANYVNHIIEGLLQHNQDITLFTDSIDYISKKYKSRCTIAFENVKNRLLWEQYSLPELLKKFKVDLYHATWNYGIPWKTSTPCILTIHDVIPLTLKKLYQPDSLMSYITFQIYKKSLALSIKKSKQILTDSVYSMNEIEKFFPRSKNKISVNYIGIDRENIAEDQIKPHFKTPYILYYGGFEKRKNIELLVDAFKKIKNHIMPVKLVLLGKKNDYYKTYLSKYEKESEIIFTDYVPDKVLQSYLKTALIFIYPSLCEGFGIPVLEAMNAGVPVIASNCSSLPEVGNGAVLYFDPKNGNELQQKIIRILKDDTLKRQMVQKGIEQSKQFDWKQHIKYLISIYKANI